MKLTHLSASNFKSLVNFDMEFAHFTCLVGLNGAGKSTVLQMLDFIAQQFRGNIDSWLHSRQWEPSDINSHLTKKLNVGFRVALDHDGRKLEWVAGFNRTSLRCTTEFVFLDGVLLLKVDDGRFTAEPSEEGRSLSGDIAFDYQGSILSVLKESQISEHLINLKQFFTGLESMDLLSPALLRSKTREAKGRLGLGGQNLSSFLFELNNETRNNLLNQLQAIYPQVNRLHIAPMRSGWKSLSVVEDFSSESLSTDARHVNDGMLRIIAILAQLCSDHDVLLFDEIENGVNAELVEFLIDKLLNTEKQIVVTTHSPMILNYLPEQEAIRGVIYLYKTPDGFTQSIPLFNIPSMREKLSFMGPGEAFVDTDLTHLLDEILSKEMVSY